MEVFKWGIMFFCFGVAVKMLVMAAASRKRGKELMSVKYRGTEEFYIVGKGSRRRDHITYCWYDIATVDGKWNHTISAQPAQYKNAQKGDRSGKRDIYAPDGKKEPFVTTVPGEKPDLSGSAEAIEAVMCVVVAVILVIAGVVAKIL